MDRPPLNLPDRFVPHGVVGRGSQAVVWLCTDRLRGERVALKVFPPQAAGSVAELRLRREVRAASLVRSPAALLPHDVHAFDGGLALSMPFHPGRTLLDRVHEGGPLPPAQVRVLAERLFAALKAAHAAGVLHRDVSPNNVLCSDDASDAVLADFGSSRPVGVSATRSALGTLGYVAPEVLAGSRGDVRADLYGAGATLYLAATGRPVGEGGLAAQLSGRFVPIRERVPSFPADLAAVIEALLAPDPADRPDGAAAVARWLEGGEAPGGRAGADVGAGAGQFLPPGRFAVWVEEAKGDRRRRREARRRLRASAPAPTAADELERWGRHLVGRLRENLGVPAADAPGTPEQRLVAAVAAEAGVTRLRESPLLWRERFRLVAEVDRACAERLAEGARLAGFRAEVAEEQTGWDPRWAAAALAALTAAGWGFTVFTAADPTVAIVLTVASVLFGARIARPAVTDRRPPAYDPHLSGALVGPATPRFARAERKKATKAEPTPAASPAARGERLRRSASEALDALAAAAREHPDLPGPFRDDLLRRVAELRTEAEALGARVDGLEAELGVHGVPPSELERLSARRERLLALRAGGEAVSAAELTQLERALAQHRADEEAAATIESHLAQATAQLVEIASTASRLRRELAVRDGGARPLATDALSREVEAMRRAARETAARVGPVGR